MGQGRQNFEDFDLNKDGCINADEFAKLRGQGPGAGMRRSQPVFTDFDANNDGYITAEELVEGRAERIREQVSQGYQMKNIPNAPSFTEMDTNKDGKLDPQEFMTHQASHNKR